MYPRLPELHRLEMVAELPEPLRRRSRSSWADKNLHGATLDAFLEGPVFGEDGTFYVVDIAFGRVLAMAPGGTWSTVADYDGWPNGMKILHDGTLLVADHKQGLVRIDRIDGGVVVVCAGFRGAPFHGLNDLTLAANGDIYFTDQGRSGLQDPYGRVFRLRPGGEPELLLDGVPSPNGLVLSPDQGTLFVAVTRANAIWRLPLQADGTTVKVGTFIQMSGGIGPDGLAFSRSGTGLLVAHPGLGVWQFGLNGVPRRFWELPGFEYTTNLVEHPMRANLFYVTESLRAAILRVDIDPEHRA